MTKNKLVRSSTKYILETNGVKVYSLYIAQILSGETVTLLLSGVVAVERL